MLRISFETQVVILLANLSALSMVLKFCKLFYLRGSAPNFLLSFVDHSFLFDEFIDVNQVKTSQSMKYWAVVLPEKEF